MNRNTILALGLAAVASFALLISPPKPKQLQPAVPAKPDCPDGRCPVPKPLPKPKPWGPKFEAGQPQLGGKTSPDGSEEIMIDLPASEKKHNVGGRDGAGLCVFTSIEYLARWQNERSLTEFQAKMRPELGGGWPEKVDVMIKKYAPTARYLQHTGGDMSILRAILNSGRAAGVTYGGYDPHYRSYVAHMVTLAHLSDKWACITDNNFPGDNEHVWMSPAEFEKRWKLGGGGWCVVLLNPPPPPVPRN